MSIQRKHIGRIPVYFGDWNDSSTYQTKNRVTLDGSEFESKIDNNIHNKPVRYDPSTQVIIYDEEHWYIISNGSYAYYAQERMNAIDSSIVELRNAIADLDASVDYRIDVLEQRVDSSFNNVQDYIEEIWAVGSTQTISVTPNVIFVNTQTPISITSKIEIPYEQANIISNKIFRGAAQIASSTNKTLTKAESVNVSTNQTYTSRIEFENKTLEKEITLYVVNKIYYGFGQNYTSALTQYKPAQRTPSGTYEINVTTPGSYVFFNIPSTMTITRVTLNGYDMPFYSPEEQTIDGVSYKSYKSTNTYDKKLLTIVVTGTTS